MTLPKITKKQIEILSLIHQFRYLNRIQIQDFLNHKDYKRINSWLKDLNEKQYLNRIYSNSIGQNTKPAIYYTGINAIKFYKTKDLYNNKYLKKLYRDSKRSYGFIEKQLFIADICLKFKKINTKGETKYQFVTAADVTSNSLYSFMEDLSPQLIFTKKTKTEYKQYVLVLLDSITPQHMVKKKIKNYIGLFYSNEWEEHTKNSFPTVLFACQTKSLLIFAKRATKKLLDDYQNPEDLELWFATIEDIKESGIMAEIWEEII